jgi:hypothetical protein
VASFGPEGPSRCRDPGRFRKESTRDAAEAYGVKAVMMTAMKPRSG